MVLLKVLFVVLVIVTVTYCSNHRVYHRIHVPTKVRTIYHTKIIKVPEHHHYIHEKEKIIVDHKSSKHHDDDEDIGLEYEQSKGYDYKPHRAYEYESFNPINEPFEGHDNLNSGSRKVQQKHKPAVRRVKHKLIKLS